MSATATRAAPTTPAVVAGLRRALPASALPMVERGGRRCAVLLAGGLAYKVHHDAPRSERCADERRANARIAPGLYRGIVDIGGEAVLAMRRLPEGCRADDRLARGALDGGSLAVLAQRMADAHRHAAPPPPGGAAGRAAALRTRALRQLGTLSGGAPEIEALRRWLDAGDDAFAARCDERAAGGHVAEAHARLHLGHVAVLDDGACGFGSLDPDPVARWRDGIDAVAAPVMDLRVHRHPELAGGLLDDYLQASGDFDGLDLLRPFVVLQAIECAALCVDPPRRRARGDGLREADYLAFALRAATPSRPRLLVVGADADLDAPPLSRRLVERAGAVAVRGDAVDDALLARVRQVLRAGLPCVVVVARAAPAGREALRRTAADGHAPCRLLARDGRVAGDALAEDERGGAIELAAGRVFSLAALIARWTEAC